MIKRKKERLEEAIDRQILRDELTPQKQLKIIATRRGASKKEKQRLELLILKSKDKKSKKKKKS